MDDNFKNDAMFILNKEIVRLRNLSEATGLNADDASILRTLVDTYTKLSSVKGKSKAQDRLITFKRVTDKSLVTQLKRKSKDTEEE